MGRESVTCSRRASAAASERSSTGDELAMVFWGVGGEEENEDADHKTRKREGEREEFAISLAFARSPLSTFLSFRLLFTWPWAA